MMNQKKSIQNTSFLLHFFTEELGVKMTAPLPPPKKKIKMKLKII